MQTKFNPDAEIIEKSIFDSGFRWRPNIVNLLNYTNIKHTYTLEGTHLYILCGVSTSGKDTLLAKALEGNKNISIIPRATSRSPRPGEIDGVSYFFNVIDALLWSTYANNIYAVPLKIFSILSEYRKAAIINGIVYAPTLKDIFEKLGAKVTILYVLPGEITDGADYLINIIAKRLSIRDTKDERLRSISNELHKVLENKEYLEKLGTIFIENTPQAIGFSKEALEKLIKILQDK